MDADIVKPSETTSEEMPQAPPEYRPPESPKQAPRPTAAVSEDHKEQLEPEEENERASSNQTCNCPPLATGSSDTAPAYQHLGAASTVQDLRRCLEARLCLPAAALRIETVQPSEREGATERGCPAAKWVLRRTSEEEKFLVLVRVRQGHVCPTAVTVIALVSWEGIPKDVADKTFDSLASELPSRGIPIERRCAANESRTCGCQGFDDATCGASYSFGCSWSMFHNACKFARTRELARKFRLRSQDAETELACKLNCLADVAGRVLKVSAPDAFQAQVKYSQLAADCRLGSEAPVDQRPFSGVTACLDFCVHAHKDTFGLDGGCNVVVTLTSSRSKDEQLHVLPGYMPCAVDEFGSERGQQERINNGVFQEIKRASFVTRVRASPMAPCAIRKKIKKSSQQQGPQKPQSSPQKHLQHQKFVKAATTKEEHSPASNDSGFESIKSNRSPDKDEQHLSPPMQAAVPPVGILPPISSWFRKSSIEWTPPHQNFQRLQQQQQLQHNPAASRQPTTNFLRPPSQPAPLIPPSADYCDSIGLANATYQRQQEQYVYPHSQQQQISGDSQLQNHTRSAEFAQPYPPSPMPPQPSQHQQQHQPPQMSQQHNLQQFSSWHGPMRHYQSPLQPYPGYASRYPTEHRQYSGGYPGQWAPQYSQPGYYNQLQQSRGFAAPQHYRSYQYPMYQQNSVQHSSYDMDYPRYQPYYPQKQHSQQQYCQMHPQYFHPRQQQGPQNPPMQPQHEAQQNQQQEQKQPQQVLKHSTPQSNFPSVEHVHQSQPIKRHTSESESKAGEGSAVTNREFLSDNAELFRDERMGGLAIALTHGSVLIEASKHDSHATTALANPDRTNPTNISLVFFQHKNLCYEHHGYGEYAEKMRQLRLRRAESNQVKMEAQTESKAEIKVEAKPNKSDA